jgi:hypothetical protein
VAGQNPTYRTSAFEAVSTLTPILVHLRRRSTPDGVRDLYYRKEELWARNGRSNLARQSDVHVVAGFFNMPQSCDMEQAALLPSEERHAEGIFARKIRRLRPGLNPRVSVPEASMLTTTPPQSLIQRSSSSCPRF